MNRKAESISSMMDVQLAKARGDFSAADSLAKSLEAVTDNEYDTMEIVEWGRYRDQAQRVRSQFHEFRRAIGELPPPRSIEELRKSKAFAGVGLRPAEEKPPAVKRRARPVGTTKGVVSKAGRGSPDAATAHHAKGKS
jgi:hypothetical protein